MRPAAVSSGVMRITSVALPGPARLAVARDTVNAGVLALVKHKHVGTTRRRAGISWRNGLQPRSSVAEGAVHTQDAGADTADAPALAELTAANARLQAENSALRAALAAAQGCAPEAVKFELAVPDGAAAEAAPAAVPAAPAAQPAPHAEGPELEAQLAGGIKWPEAGEGEFWDREARTSPLLVGGMQLPPPTRDARSLHIVHLTAEMAPCAKVGGLGDVVTGLARAALQRGHTVDIMLPYYECLPDDAVQDLQLDCEFDCPKGYCWDGQFQQGTLRTQLFRAKIDGIPVLLVRPDWGAVNLFKGGRIYGGSYNETEAYLYFSRACLEALLVSGRQPHVLHCHEWQTSAAAMLYWDVYNAGGLHKPRVMLTIHNFDSTGEVRQDEFAITGVDGGAFADVEKALDERTIGHNPERLSLLKGGIVYSNFVTTVSPTYAREALEGGAAGWLRTVLSKPGANAKFHGVLNGIDTAMWDPSADTLLPASYAPGRMAGKALCKRYLQQGLGLDVDPSKPLVACITRLVPQKGIHLIQRSIYRTVEQGGQYVLLGSGHSDGAFRAMAEGEYKDHASARLLVMYSERLAHLIYAAADIVLVPSMFEPCGLTQLIALRYGAVPVVRATGGLADTVKDVDDPEQPQPNGFTFGGTDEGSLDGALDRALRYYKEKPEWWSELSEGNMQIDCSWNTSASQYVKLYLDMADPN